MDRDEISILYRGPSIDASYQVSVHLAEGFQRRRLKCEKLTNDGRQKSGKNGKRTTSQLILKLPEIKILSMIGRNEREHFKTRG
jgi:predicted Fe-Mo cluster-binding NifX family protein